MGRPAKFREALRHAIRFPQLGVDLPREPRQRRLMISRDMSDKLLPALLFLVQQVGDPLSRLVVEFGKQPGQILDGVPRHELALQTLDECCDQHLHRGRKVMPKLKNRLRM